MSPKRIQVCREALDELRKDVLTLLVPVDDTDEMNAILEIRAGVGGDEASLFALDLHRMYEVTLCGFDVYSF